MRFFNSHNESDKPTEELLEALNTERLFGNSEDVAESIWSALYKRPGVDKELLEKADHGKLNQ